MCCIKLQTHVCNLATLMRIQLFFLQLHECSCAFTREASHLHDLHCVHVSGGMKISQACMRVYKLLYVWGSGCVHPRLTGSGTQCDGESFLLGRIQSREPPVLLLLSTLIAITGHFCSFTPIDAFGVFSSLARFRVSPPLLPMGPCVEKQKQSGRSGDVPAWAVSSGSSCFLGDPHVFHSATDHWCQSAVCAESITCVWLSN